MTSPTTADSPAALHAASRRDVLHDPANDPDPIFVVRGWPELPSPPRAAILAMLAAAMTG